MAAAARKRGADPDWRSERRAAALSQWADPEGYMQRAMTRPDTRAKIRAGLAKPEAKAKMSAAQKAIWADPERREERLTQLKIAARLSSQHTLPSRQDVSAALVGSKRSALTRDKISAAATELWKSAEYREAVISGLATARTRRLRSSVQDSRLLAAIANEPRGPATEWAKRAGLSKAALVHARNRLEKRGDIVWRERDRVWEITPNGQLRLKSGEEHKHKKPTTA